MYKKILVSYASKTGFTEGVAEVIGKTLAEGGAEVDVLPLQSVASLEGYRAVVLGSAINGGKWLPEVSSFLQTHQERLRQLPTAFFLVCLMQANPARHPLVGQFLAAERALVKPVAEGRFVGGFDTKKFNFLTRLGIRFFTAYCGLGFRTGDFRDPAAVRAWTTSLQPLLQG
jgi:menaquinone-dependent protoporphyrinogen oxidase